ncbi:MAG: DUF389 domain-containing protein [Prochlorococcus sp.]
MEGIGRPSDLISFHIDEALSTRELYKGRETASKLSVAYLVLLISAAAIATLGLLANSSAVIIGAMIVAPLMDPILSMAFGIAISNRTMTTRSLLTILIGCLLVIGTSWTIASIIDIAQVKSEVWNRITPNLIDLGVAIAAAIAGSFSLTRARISNSIAGVAIAVALVPPLCVTGIGLSFGSSFIAQIGRNNLPGLTNQIAQGSFLLFLANLVGIAISSIIIFLILGYGSLLKCWRGLMICLALVGIICIPLSSSLNEFKLKYELESRFAEFKEGRIERVTASSSQGSTWKRVKMLYNNVIISDKTARVEVILQAPESLLQESELMRVNSGFIEEMRKLGLKDIQTDIRVIPTQMFKFHSNI